VPRCVPFLEPKLALISGEWHKEAWCQRRGQVGTELKIIRCAGTPFSSCGGRYRGGWLDKGSNNPPKKNAARADVSRVPYLHEHPRLGPSRSRGALCPH
jgi:hypothetical protein